MPVLDLKDASAMVAEVSLLNDTMKSLAQQIDDRKAQLEENKKEIKKREGLEEANLAIESAIKKLRKEHAARRGERQQRVESLTAAGWVVPMPKDDGAKGSISM